MAVSADVRRENSLLSKSGGVSSSEAEALSGYAEAKVRERGQTRAEDEEGKSGEEIKIAIIHRRQQ